MDDDMSSSKIYEKPHIKNLTVNDDVFSNKNMFNYQPSYKDMPSSSYN